MPITLIALLVAFGFVAYFAWRNKGTRNCRWRKDSMKDRDTLHFYHCVTCGAEAYTATDGPPRDCKAKVTSRPL